jgi:hypothetical protein
MDLVGVQERGHRYLITKFCLVGTQQEEVVLEVMDLGRVQEKGQMYFILKFCMGGHLTGRGRA